MAEETQAFAVLEGEAVAGPQFDLDRQATDRMLLVRGTLRLDGVDSGRRGTQRA